MTTLIKDALKGIAVAVVAAFFFVALSVLLDMLVNPENRGPKDEIAAAFVAGPAWALSVYSWFVIPAGALVGIVLGYSTRRCSRRQAIWRGVIAGVALGIVGSVLLNVFDALPVLRHATIPDHSVWWAVFWERVAFGALNMAWYCTLWTVAYAYLRARSRSARVAPVT